MKIENGFKATGSIYKGMTMDAQILFKRLVFLTFTPIILILSACTSTEVPTDANATDPDCTVSPSAFNSWFASGTVTQNGVVDPANSVTFPNDPNCSFYAWSEQMFLWLTSPSPPNYGGGSAPIFGSPAFYTVSPMENGVRKFIKNSTGGFRNFGLRMAQVGVNRLPTFIERKTLRMFESLPAEVSPKGHQLIFDGNGKKMELGSIKLNEKRMPMFFDREGKQFRQARPIIPKELLREKIAQKFVFGKEIFFIGVNGNLVEPEIGQASGDVLMAQNGSLVYYTTTVNPVFAYFLTGVKNGAISIPPPPSENQPAWMNAQFPTTQSDLDEILAFASDQGATLVDPEALAVEVKTSWIEASSVHNPQDYITLNAEIPTYTPDATNDTWTQTGTKVAKLALVGIHVVGSTQGHPEMIWATFEHINNTPNVAYTYRNQNGETVNVPSDIDAGLWLFSANNSPGPFNQSHMHFDGTVDPVEIRSVDPFQITPSDTRRDFPWGMAPDATTSNTEIIAINNSVRGQLLAGDLRKNYIMTGATWTIGGQSPAGPISSGGNEVGTFKLANSTMETYDTASNCFTCHGSNKVRVSHIFDPLEALP